MVKFLKYLMFILLFMQIVQCKDPFEPPAIAGKSSYLVVDGIIVSGNGLTTLTLTRSTGWHDPASIKYEQFAVVQLEGEDKSVYLLQETGIGQYTTDSLALNRNIKYSLKIKTRDGNVYASEFVPVLATPPIDSISWKQERAGTLPNVQNLSLYVNTHDPKNKTRYYLWNYEETWKYRAPVLSYLKYKDTVIDFRHIYYVDYATTEEMNKLYFCWRSDKSKSIIIANSLKLSQDIISMKKLTAIEGNSIKKSFVYSINVFQYAVSQQAYEFYDILQKNSEQTGSLFDPQPSEIPGNIKNVTNPGEPVIGFVSISTLSQKRIYINKDLYYIYTGDCEIQNLFSLDVSLIQYPYHNYPVNFLIDPGSRAIIGYKIAPARCVNCELMGGSNIKPVFWPDSL